MTSIPRAFGHLALVSLTLAALPSCSAMKGLAVAPSAFVEHGKELKPDRARSPFLGNWTSPSAASVMAKRRSIYIAPVNLAHMRPMTRSMSKAECSETSRQVAAKGLAQYASTKLADAFHRSPSPRYQLCNQPDKDSITLELAIVDLNPNPVSGGFLRTTLGAFAAPGVDSVIAKRLKGNIAMEAKVSDSASKQLLYEFADNEENKSPLILSITDFSNYAQARQAIGEWALQMEEMLRTSPDKKVKDSSAFVFLPWN